MNMPFMLVTLLTSHPDKSAVFAKRLAPENIWLISVTAPTFQELRSWLKSLADSNMRLMSVTFLTSQPDISWLKFHLLEKSPDMSVTSEVSQSAISAVPASPQSAPPPPSGSLTGLQHLSPVETLLRHFSTAVMSRALLANAAACVVERHAATMLTSKSQWGRVPAQYPRPRLEASADISPPPAIEGDGESLIAP